MKRETVDHCDNTETDDNIFNQKDSFIHECFSIKIYGTFCIQSYATSSNLQIKIFHIHCIYPPSVLVKNIKQSDDSELLIGESCYYCQNTQNSHSLQLHTFLQKFFDVKENNNFVLLHKMRRRGKK